MRRTLVALAAAGVVVGLASGCSETPEDVRADYCELVSERQAELSEVLADDSPDALLTALPVFRDLAEEAPRDLTDDWETFIVALEGLQEALDEAGADPATYDADDPPEGVTREQRDDIAAAADELFSPEVTAAYDGVKQQATDVCKTPLFQ